MRCIEMQLKTNKRATLRDVSGVIRAALCGLVLVAASGSSSAQQWPTKTLRIVVNGPAGGSVDTVLRLVSVNLAQRLGTPVIVENKSGGSGLIGTQEVLRASPDGSTFLASLDGVFTEVPHSVKISFDPLKDMTPVVDLFSNGWVLVSNETVPAKSLTDAVSWAKSRQEGLSYGSFSSGTISHILGAQMAKSAGLRLNHVPFRGGADAMQALLGGHVNVLFSGVVQALPYVKAGKLTALAFSGPDRSPSLPNVPTFKEAGYPDLTALSWVGIFARKEVPAPLRERLHKEIAAVLAQPEVREKIMAIGTNPAKPRSSVELIHQMSVDSPRAELVLQAAGVKPQ